MSAEFPDLLPRCEDAHVVVLSVKSLSDLHLLQKKASYDGIPHEWFVEPDLSDELTAIAFPPCKETRQLLRGLPLAMRGGENSDPI